MTLITHSTDSLVGGVSQQPAIKRLPAQCEAQENALGTVVEGLRKRPPTEHLGTLTSAPTGTAAYHTINRDAAERYVVAVESKALRVYSLDDGTSQDLYDANGDVAQLGVGGDFDYLETSDPVGDLEFLTIADATIVVNKSVQPKMSANTTADRGEEGLIFLKQGNYGTKYIVDVEGRVVTVETGDGSVSTDIKGVQTNYISELIRDHLVSGAPTPPAYNVTVGTSGSPLSTGWDITREGSTIHVAKDDGSAFDMSTDDSVGSSVLAVIKGSVQSFSSLPTIAPEGFVVQIDGVPDQGGAGAGAYYVRFETTEGGASSFGDGVWEESVAGGIEYTPDPATMPHLLVRLSSGDFLWTPLDGSTLGGTIGSTVDYTAPSWGGIGAGDENTNPRPAFLQTSAGADGELIRGISFYKDRLVLLSGETAVLSESGQYFNFFRTTVTTLLDSARMSVVAAGTRVNLLNSAVALRGNLVLFSESTQFVLTGGVDGTVTPTNVSVAVASEYESTVGAQPKAARQSIFFAGTRGSSTTVRELYDASTNRPEYGAVDVTGQVPTYIAGAAVEMAASPTEDCLVLIAGDETTLYVYKWQVNGGERVQSAWSKFTIGGTDAEILSITWVEQYLHLVVRRGNQTSIERMDFEPFLNDPYADFRVHLDRRLSDSSSGVSSSYDSGTNTTTFTLPYTLGAGVTMQVVSRGTASTNAGQDYPVTSSGAASVTVSGDHTGTPVYIGEAYTMRYEFSQLQLQRNGRVAPMGNASHRVRYGRINFSDTSYFVVRVTVKGQAAQSYVWNGYILGESESLLGSIGTYTGEYQFPVMASHDRVTIELENDSPLASTFVAAEWEAYYHSRIRFNARF